MEIANTENLKTKALKTEIPKMEIPKMEIPKMEIPKMETRHISPEENVHAQALRARVFLSSSRDVDYTERFNNPMEHTKGYEDVWGVFDGDGQICSTLIVSPYEMMFDGHVTGMGGIGGVATLPEARSGGAVRGVFEKCIPEMYEKGMTFSYLYPFSHEFYRKFGYELSFTATDAIIPMTALESYPRPSHMSFYDMGRPDAAAILGEIKVIYESFTKDKNLAAVRGDERFRAILDKSPYTSNQYTYVHRNSLGEADCYVIYNPKLDGNGNTVMIKELAWTSPSGLHGMLGFLAGLKPQFRQVKWEAPSCVNVYSLFPECYDIRQSSFLNGMLRVVNLSKAFGYMRYPALFSGKVVISVSDKFFPVNTGTYLLEWGGGAGAAKKLSNAADCSADLVADIETIAQLLAGYLTPVQALYKKNFIINSGMDALTALFPLKPLCIYEKF